MGSLCVSAYVSVNCTRFAQLPVVNVRLYKGGAAEIFRFDLPIDLRSDPSVSKVVQQFGFVVQYIFHDRKFYLTPFSRGLPLKIRNESL